MDPPIWTNCAAAGGGVYRVRKQQTELSRSSLDANKVEIGVGEYATADLLPGKMRFGIPTLGGRGHDAQMPAAILDARVDVRKELFCIAGDRRRPRAAAVVAHHDFTDDAQWLDS